ncbi:MAG: nucleotide sugar dehydrogenase [Ignavibacteriales bacterium]|nr:nucleotide sugar dehydrogenase [Ignavibacteriales bacterium]
MVLLKKIEDQTAKIGIIGLGYVGLPLGIEFAHKGFKVIGFDVDNSKVIDLLKGKSYIKHIPSKSIKVVISNKNLEPTSDFSRIKEVDVIIICVPTPLNKNREPDLSYVENTAMTIAKYMRKGQLITLESTTYPGTTDELLLPIFENARGNEKFVVGKDFYLAFSPEREDPNNPEFTTAKIPKVVGGYTKSCLKIAQALYDKVIVRTVPVSSTRAAEATKLLENIFRSVNIALVNELKMVFNKMNIDVWEVIEAASTKPFGYKAFYPGPGLGGHCIPIDPFYLTWKAREYDISTRFIELAGEVNTFMPYYVVENAILFLNKYKKTLNNSKVLILGAAYKKDVDDLRESPTLKLIELFRDLGAKVDYNDPYIAKLPKMRMYKYNMKSVPLNKATLKKYDLVVISTDHSNYDYKFIANNASLILDTRNAMNRNGIFSKKIFKS